MAVAVNIILLIPILLPFLLGVIIFGLRKWLKSFSGEIAVAGIIAVTAFLGAIITQVKASTTKIIYGVYDTSLGVEYAPPTGVQLRSDGVSSWILLFLNIILIFVLIYETSKIREKQNAPIYVSFFLLLISGINGTFIAYDFFTLFLSWVIIGISLILLITFDRTKEDLRVGGVKAYMTIGFAIALLLLAVILTYGLFGTLNFAFIFENGLFNATLLQNLNLLVYFIIALVIISLGIFANLFLLNIWTTSTIQNARTGVKIMVTGFTSIAAVFSIIRILNSIFNPAIFPGTNYSFVIAGIGLVTAFEGIFLIVGQLIKKEDVNLMKIIVYTTFVNIGIVLTALSFNGIISGENLAEVKLLQDCLGYGFLHMANIAATIFLSYICIEKFANASGGSYDLREMRGIGKDLPVSGFIFTVSLLSNVGILPT
ncbi:MAG: proton-conducting transporter transmembrane domain-containing protein, partial [Candidatus Heimdallarchaeota archaeon]